MKALGIGEIVLDKVCILDGYPKEGEKVQPNKIEYSVGGPVPAALILLSRLGVECSLIASVGDDDLAQKIKKELMKENINFIPIVQKKTKMNTVLVNAENGSRTIIKDSVKHEPIQNISKRTVQNADVILFDRHEPLAFDEVVKKKRKDVQIILDPSTEVSPKTLKMFQAVDYPIIPVECLSKFRLHKGLKENLENFYHMVRKEIVVTLGDKGSLIYNGQNINYEPAVQVKVVDTLGAGDIYRGAFGYGVLMKWDIRECARYGNIVAGLQCTRVGNSKAIPQKGEIEEFRMKATFKEMKTKDFLSKKIGM